MTPTATRSIDTDTRIGQIAAEHPTFASLLDRLHIDYCCGGDQTLAAACQEQDLDPQTVVRLLEASGEMETEAASQPNWSDMATGELIAHIEETHHAYLREELPRLETLIDKVSRVHGEEAPWLFTIREIFAELKPALLAHIETEEEVVFPYILAAEKGGPAPDLEELEGDPVALMEEDHAETGAAVERIRKLTDAFEVPGWACASLAETIERLEELESDVHAHVHKENNILFPRLADA